MTNPYAGKPDHQFWRQSVSGRGPEQVGSVVRVPFGIARADKVATAASCFAQHVTRHLGDTGKGREGKRIQTVGETSYLRRLSFIGEGGAMPQRWLFRLNTTLYNGRGSSSPIAAPSVTK